MADGAAVTVRRAEVREVQELGAGLRYWWTVRSKIVWNWSPAVSDPVTYTSALPCRRSTVEYLSVLLATQRRRRGTRSGRRSLGTFAQAVLVLRWFFDRTRLAQLATDNAISSTTAYRYLHEGIATSWPRRRPPVTGPCWPRTQPAIPTS